MAYVVSSRLRSWAVALAVLALIALPAVALAQGARTVSGNAFGVSAEGVVDIAPTPQVTLPAGGGQESDRVASLNQAGITTGVLEVRTAGSTADGGSSATATVDGLSVTLAGETTPAVTATTLRATSESACAAGRAESSGSSVVEQLNVGGEAVTVTGAPNQTVDIPGGLGTVVINEQIGGDGDLAVNALRIRITAAGQEQEVVVAHAESDIACNVGDDQEDELPDTGGSPAGPVSPAIPLAGAALAGLAAFGLRRRAV